MQSYAKGIRDIYSASMLAEIAKWAKALEWSESGDREYSDLQRKIIQSHFPGFFFDFLTTSIIICDENYMPVDANVVCLNISNALVDGYSTVAEFDEISPLSYMNTGRAVSSENLRSMDEWKTQPIFELHCRFFDIAKMLTISFRSREHARKYLAFEYIASSDQISWKHFDHNQLELATFPFALAWYYRKGMMDDAMLEQRFLALSGLTETQLSHIRKHVNSPGLSLLEQSEALEISEAWLKENLYETRDLLAPRLKWEIPKKKTQSSLRYLQREFHFMDMLGDPTCFNNPFDQSFSF